MYWNYYNIVFAQTDVPGRLISKSAAVVDGSGMGRNAVFRTNGLTWLLPLGWSVQLL